CSLISNPGSDVAIGEKSPPVGAPFLRSHMSIVAGPPPIHSMMHDLWRRRMSVALASTELVNDMAGTTMAEAPATCVMKWRRVIPSGTRRKLISLSRPLAAKEVIGPAY